jgi:hypothetical protein
VKTLSTFFQKVSGNVLSYATSSFFNTPVLPPVLEKVELNLQISDAGWHGVCIVVGLNVVVYQHLEIHKT